MSSSAIKKPVYLRGIPSDVVREAKAVAARRGISLAGFVADTLARAVLEQGSARERGDDLSAEMRWFERQRERLAREYGGEYVAIVDNRVLDHDEDFEALAERVFAKEGVRNIFMPRLTAGERTVRARSPRLSREVKPAKPARAVNQR
jgi:hypothetical protein